jgi:DNA-binding IclR family transcriptional regulator
VTEDSAQPTDDAEPADRSTTADLLKLIEEFATFDRIGVTRLSRHSRHTCADRPRMLRALERAGYVEPSSCDESPAKGSYQVHRGAERSGRHALTPVLAVLAVRGRARRLGLTA